MIIGFYPIVGDILHDATVRTIEEGTHNNWSCNKSKGNYVERYWNFILSSVYRLETDLQHRVSCDLISNNNHFYYLDILVNGKFDLEIDGPFHEEERDKVRDEFLSFKGYVVYRVPYVDPRKEKDKVLSQIQEFVNYINHHMQV